MDGKMNQERLRRLERLRRFPAAEKVPDCVFLDRGEGKQDVVIYGDGTLQPVPDGLAVLREFVRHPIKVYGGLDPHDC
jgi:hypothetical protein